MTTASDFLRTIKDNVGASESQFRGVFSQIVHFTSLPNANSITPPNPSFSSFSIFLQAMILLFNDEVASAEFHSKFSKLFQVLVESTVDTFVESTKEIDLSQVGPVAVLAHLDQKRQMNPLFNSLYLVLELCFRYDADWNKSLTCHYVLARCAADSSAAPFVLAYFVGTQLQPRKVCLVLHEIGLQLACAKPNYVLTQLAAAKYDSLTIPPKKLTDDQQLFAAFLRLLPSAHDLCSSDFVTTLWELFESILCKPVRPEVEVPAKRLGPIAVDNVFMGYVFTLIIYLPGLLDGMCESSFWGKLLGPDCIRGFASLLDCTCTMSQSFANGGGAHKAKGGNRSDGEPAPSDVESAEEGELGSELQRYASVAILRRAQSVTPLSQLFSHFVTFLMLQRPRAVGYVIILLEKLSRCGATLKRRHKDGVAAGDELQCTRYISRLRSFLLLAKLCSLNVSAKRAYVERRFLNAKLGCDKKLLQELDYVSYVAAFESGVERCYSEMLFLMLESSNVVAGSQFKSFVSFVFFHRAQQVRRGVEGAAAKLESDLSCLLLFLNPLATGSASATWDWAWVHDMAEIVGSDDFFVNAVRLALIRVEQVAKDGIHSLEAQGKGTVGGTLVEPPAPDESKQPSTWQPIFSNLILCLQSVLLSLVQTSDRSKGMLRFQLEDSLRLLRLCSRLEATRNLAVPVAVRQAVTVVFSNALRNSCYDFNTDLESTLPPIQRTLELACGILLRDLSLHKSLEDSGLRLLISLVSALASCGSTCPRHYTLAQVHSLVEGVFRRLVASLFDREVSVEQSDYDERDSHRDGQVVLCLGRLLSVLRCALPSPVYGSLTHSTPETWLGAVLESELQLANEPTPTLLYDYFFPQVVWYSRQLDDTFRTFCWPYDLEVWFNFEKHPALWDVLEMVLIGADFWPGSPLVPVVQSLLAALVAYWCHFHHQGNAAKFSLALDRTRKFVGSLCQRLISSPFTVSLGSGVSHAGSQTGYLQQSWDGRPELHAVLALLDVVKGADISLLLERIVWPIVQQVVLDHTEWYSNKKLLVDTTDRVDPHSLSSGTSRANIDYFTKLARSQVLARLENPPAQENFQVLSLFARSDSVKSVAPTASAVGHLQASKLECNSCSQRFKRPAPTNLGLLRLEMRKLLEGVVKRDLQTYAQYQWCLQLL